MYDELVKQLKELPHLLFVQLHGHENVVYEAADAIEELDTLLDGVKADNEALCETIERLKKPHWVSVTERLPNPEVEVLVYTKDHRIGIDKFFGMILDKPTFSKKGMNRVTHWMPTPKPPQEEELDVQSEI